MINSQRPKSEEIEQLLLNAQLRNEIEPYLDESVDLLNIRRLPTSRENEFLESMLAWERAPILPISRWMTPELTLPHPDKLENEQLHELLWETIHQLYDNNIILDFTDHLSDRELYCVIYRDILPSPEKKIEMPRNFLHWHCIDIDEDPHTWLRYYASDEERREWASVNNRPLPSPVKVPFPRKMPCRPHGAS